MKDSSSPFVSIITVNFNGIFFLKTLFDSIASLNYPKEKLQVIMVDNGSTDGSVSYVKSSYPFVEILKINKNRKVVKKHGRNYKRDYDCARC